MQLTADDDKLSREEALRLFAVGTAWFSGEESVKGRIAPGQYADFTILNNDYFGVPEEQINGSMIRWRSRGAAPPGAP